MYALLCALVWFVVCAGLQLCVWIVMCLCVFMRALLHDVVWFVVRCVLVFVCVVFVFDVLARCV